MISAKTLNSIQRLGTRSSRETGIFGCTLGVFEMLLPTFIPVQRSKARATNSHFVNQTGFFSGFLLMF